MESDRTEVVVLRTIDIIYALFRQYIVPSGGEASAAAIVRLLETFDVSEDAARCTVSRLKRDGLLACRRTGSRSYYRLTKRGVARARIGETAERPDPPDWDGRWWFVSYCLPNVKRAWRDELRHYVEWLGYGRLGQGQYLSPYGYTDLLQERLRELGIGKWVDIYSAEYHGGRDPRSIAGDTWRLDALAGRYGDFLAKHEPLAKRFRDVGGARSPLHGPLSFVGHLYLVTDYQAVAHDDPRLPASMLPDGWSGGRARAFFRDYQASLAKPAAKYFEEICKEA